MLYLVVRRCRLWVLRYGLNSALFCVFVCVCMKAVGCCFHVWQMRVSNLKKCWYSFCSISQIKKPCIQYDTLFGVSLSHECLTQRMVVFVFPFFYDDMTRYQLKGNNILYLHLVMFWRIFWMCHYSIAYWVRLMP